MLHFKMSQLQIKVICGNVLQLTAEALLHLDLAEVKLSRVTDVDGLQCFHVSQ